MAAEYGHQAGKQRRQAITPVEMIANAACFGQAVTDLAEIARAAASGNHPAQRAADIGQGPQHGAQIAAQQRIVMQPLDHAQALFNGVGVGEGGGKIIGQQACACACHAAVHRRDQAALASALLRFQDFEAAPGCLVHGQAGVALAHHRGQQQGQFAAADMVEIGDQPASSGQHRAGKLAKPVQRGDRMDCLQPGIALFAGKVAAGAGDDIVRCVVPAIRADQFAGAQTGQRGAHAFGRAFFEFHPSGGNVAGGDPDHTAHFAGGGQHVGPARFEQGLFRQRSGGDETDDIARHQRFRSATFLCFFRGFDLFGDGHAASALDQACKIVFRRVHRNPAHRDRLAVMFAPAGQRNVEDLRGNPGIVEEQFEEIAHSIEQQTIVSAFLQNEILRHHRGCGCGHIHAVAAADAIREA